MTESQLNSVIESKNLNIESLNQLVFELKEQLRSKGRDIRILKEQVKYESKMKDAYIKSYREVSCK